MAPEFSTSAFVALPPPPPFVTKQYNLVPAYKLGSKQAHRATYWPFVHGSDAGWGLSNRRPAPPPHMSQVARGGFHLYFKYR